MQNAKVTAMREMQLPSYVLTAIETLKECGFTGYVVGGSVRDHIIGNTINDFDICTNCPPDNLSSVFSSHKTVNTGIKHGTVTVLIEGQHLELTTFRKDGEYSDGRHPDSVTFTNDIYEDLSRRDFTVNAVAYNPDHGYIDPFNGISDIHNKVIRCVGNPEKRFKEDALRIFRAVRFSSVLGFDIEKDTDKQIFALKDKLDLVSRERIRDEFNKLLIGKFQYKTLNDYREIIAKAIPELKATFNFDQNNPHHEFDLYTHLIKTAEKMPREPLLCLCGLLHDIGKPQTMSLDEKGISHYYSHAAVSADMTESIMKRLRYSNDEISFVKTLVRYHDGVIDETERAVKRRINQLDIDGFFNLISLQKADNLSQTTAVDKDRMIHYEKLIAISNEVISSKACVKKSDLAVNGHDIAELGFVGKDIGTILAHVLSRVIDGDISNDKSLIIKYVRSNGEDLIKGIST